MSSMKINRLDDLLSREETAKMLGVKVQTLAVWQSSKRYPLKCIKIGRKTVKYKRADILDFIKWSAEQGNLDKGAPKAIDLQLPSSQVTPIPTQDPPAK